MSSPQPVYVSPGSRMLAFALVVLAVGVAIYGLIAAPERTWPNLLLDGFYVASLGVSAILFLAVQRVAGSRWSADLRRIPEAFLLLVPVSAVLLLLVLFGRHMLFGWTKPDAFANLPLVGGKVIAGKAQYLNPPFVYGRMVFSLAVWILFAWLFRKSSLEQDKNPNQSIQIHKRLTSYSVIFLLFFALTFTFSVFDWILSLDATWSTTMFGFYMFAGTFVQGIAAVTLAVAILRERGSLPGVGWHQQHDLGKLLFAFSTFWAYIWTCQYLLIWYGNIPEEVTHYVKRTNGPWLPFFALNLILNWVVPFLALLSIRRKVVPGIIKTIAITVLIGRWLDWYMLITPSVWDAPKIGIFEIFIATGYAGLVYLIFTREINKAPIVPLNDPILQYEKLHPVLTPELIYRSHSGAKS